MKNVNPFHRLSGSIALLLVTSVAPGCGFLDGSGITGDDTPGYDDRGQFAPQSSLALTKFADCDDLKGYVADSLTQQLIQQPYARGCWDCVISDDGGVPALEGADASGSSSGGGVPDDVSQTNTQEEGVDEADIVKTDADGNLYIVSGGKLNVVDGFPPTAMVTSGTVDLKAQAFDMFLDEENRRAVIFANSYLYDNGYGGKPGGIVSDTDIAQGYTYPNVQPELEAAPFTSAQVIFVDVADATAPKITQRLFVEGYYMDSRRIGDRMHVVSRFTPPSPESLMSDEDFWKLVNNYQQLWWQREYAKNGGGDVPSGNGVGGGEVPPGDGVVSSEPEPAATDVAAAPESWPRNETEAALDEEIEYLKGLISSRIHTAVAAMDTQLLLPRSVVRTGTVDADAKLLTCENVYHPDVELNPGLLVVTSAGTDGDDAESTGVMNNAWLVYGSESNLYVSQSSAGWWWSRSQSSQTAVYKFGISDDAPQYKGVGVVDGWANNQFNYSEHEGHLRIATTQPSWGEDGSRDQSNNLFVLADDGAGSLAIAGEVRGYGQDESIQSVRFVGDKGFVVTFRQTDPLFAFDLTDPAHPRLAGSVSIPGFSTYMHPIDDDHLLTIGVSGNELGATWQPELQVFDVSNLANPVRTHALTLDSGNGSYGWSEAQYDHHAFTWYAPKNLLAIPLVTANLDTGKYFAGITAFTVSPETGIVGVGAVDHADLAEQLYCSDLANAEAWQTYECSYGNFIWAANPRRSVFMTSGADTYLYSISNLGVKATNVTDPATLLGSVTLPQQPYGWWWWY